MSVTQIPPRDPLAPAPPPPVEPRDLSDAEHWETAYRGFDPGAVPHLLVQLQDDLSRSRKREALWLSVVIHLLVVILLVNSTRLMDLLPHRALVLPANIDLDKQKDATYLELPPDEQKLTRRPDAKVLSDKDRIATSKAPQINREDLKKLLPSPRPGRMGQKGPQQQQAPPPAIAQNQQPQEQQQPNPNQGLVAPAQNPPVAQLQTPPRGAPPSFTTPSTVGSAIEQAARAALANRGNYGGGGEQGDSGLNQGRSGAKALDNAEILTDTLGVDFGPYLARVVQTVRQNWYNVLPPSVYPPILKQGKLSIEFAIQKDGKVSGMTLHTTSGDVSLDRAAWASITASNPFPPLPREFIAQASQQGRDPSLGLRFYYFYNLEKIDMK